MDLGFPRFDKQVPLATLPSDLAVLMVEIAARQAASPTAAAHARAALAPPEAQVFAPADGAFNAAVAAALTKWKDE